MYLNSFYVYNMEYFFENNLTEFNIILVYLLRNIIVVMSL